MSENITDVLIVGGGPSGLAAAIALRQRGLQVTVADGLEPPIDKACGEGLMPDSREELRRLGVELAASDGAEFHGIHFASHPASWSQRKPASKILSKPGPREAVAGKRPGEHQVTADFSNGLGLGIRRLRLHQKLVDRAREAGVDLRWSSPVQFLDSGELRIGGRKLSYGYLVGADGQSSRVRSFAGLDKGTLLSRRFGFRAHYRVTPWSRSATGESLRHVEVHWGQHGQAYLTPIGRNEICVAVVSRNPRVRVDEIMSSLPSLRDKLSGAECLTRERGAVTTTRRLRQVATRRIALIGDASGSADAVTGEGMAMAFRQAVLLAAAIEQDDLKLYAAAHPATLHMPQTMARVLLMMDRFPLFRDRAMSMLARDPALFAQMLDVHLGGETLFSFVRREGFKVGWGLLAPVPS